MQKHFYSEYVRHCMRFYARNPNKSRFNTEVDRNNWCACHRAIDHYSEREKDILIHIYALYDTLADNVYEVARMYGIDQNVIWDLLKEFEKSVAKKRGLI